MTLVHVDQQQPDLARMSLDELAAVANREHEAVEAIRESVRRHIEAGLSQGVFRGIAAGQALSEAKVRVEPGQWMAWVEAETKIGYTMAVKYMRWARYRDHLLIAGTSEHITVTNVWKVLKGLSPSGAPPTKVHLREECRRLHESQMRSQDIAALLEISHTTVRRFIDPEYDKKNREASRRARARRRAAARALRQGDISQQIKRVGGSVADAYAQLRRGALLLDKAISDSGDRAEREALRSALVAAHKAEDEIVRALKIERMAS